MKVKKNNSALSSFSSKYSERTTTSNNGTNSSSVVTRKMSQHSSHYRKTKEKFSRTTPLELLKGAAACLGPFQNDNNSFSPQHGGRKSGSSENRNKLNSRTSSSYPSRSSPPYLPAPNVGIIPTYSNNCSKRGKALIINNIKFIDENDERQGAKKDSEDLEKLFKMLDFEVHAKTNMKGKKMLDKVEKFSKSNFSNHDMSIVIIMSHGSNVKREEDKYVTVQGGYTEISGTDNVGLSVDRIVEKFSATNSHASLKGKPKIFIFQCCRGKNVQEFCNDVATDKMVLRAHSDILIAFSTLPGYLSNRDKKSGTWYIQILCEVFGRYYKTYHVEEMLKLVDEQLSTKHPRYAQTSSYESRGFKRCYLHPMGVNK